MFKYILLGTALLIAASAGFFSITGIGQLFTGAVVSAMVMAAGLELGKLVSISFLFRYWTKIKFGMRVYFIAAAVVLMAITSTGVYGYLSAAYAQAATGIKASENQITLLDAQKASLDKSIQRLTDRSQSLQNARTQQENRLDKLVGQRGLATQQQAIAQSDKAVTDLQNQIMKLQTQRDSVDAQQTTVRSGISTTGKLGTFYYIAQSFGIPLDTIVHWFILAIVFVFDPLSVSLILAYQISVREEDEMPTEIDFSNGLRGKFSEQTVEEFMESPERKNMLAPEWVPPPPVRDDAEQQRYRDGLRGERSS
jgi:hypothetical protein